MAAYSYADLKGDKPFVLPAEHSREVFSREQLEGNSTEQQLSLEAALAKREAVLAEVAEDNAGWMAEAIRACGSLPIGELGTGEDIKEQLLQAGLRAPRHPNVWGALFNTLTRRGVLVATGEFRPMRAKSSNGRKTSVYAKAAPELVA